MATQIGKWTLTPYRYWRTADGRFIFQPCGEGWVVVATNKDDRQLLHEADVSTDVQLPTLQSWVRICHQLFDSSPQIRRQTQSYHVEQTPLSLTRQYRQYWGFARNSITSPKISGGTAAHYEHETYEHKAALFWDRVYRHIRNHHYATRAEALQALTQVIQAESLLPVESPRTPTV